MHENDIKNIKLSEILLFFVHFRVKNHKKYKLCHVFMIFQFGSGTVRGRDCMWAAREGYTHDTIVASCTQIILFDFLWKIVNVTYNLTRVTLLSGLIA